MSARPTCHPSVPKAQTGILNLAMVLLAANGYLLFIYCLLNQCANTKKPGFCRGTELLNISF